MLVDDVRKALRINNYNRDAEISVMIQTARKEMIRAGVAEDAANSDDELVEYAIRTFCLWQMTNNEKFVDKYKDSWQYQLDNLRKSETYTDALKGCDCDV